MKPKLCTCMQCKAVKRNTTKKQRNQTYQLRAARHRVKQLLRTLPVDKIDDVLDQRVSVEYYG